MVFPRYVGYSARAIPAAILAQFLLAGLSLFQDASFWGWHATLGSFIIVPIALMLFAATTNSTLRSLRVGVWVLVALSVLQIVLIVAGQNYASGVLQALHPFNAGLLLTAALHVLKKTAWTGTSVEAQSGY